jgi:LysM repeat protein
MESHRRSPLRLLAPIALIVAALALVLVLSNSGGNGDSSGSTSANSAEKARDLGQTPQERRRAQRHKDSGKLPSDVYIVKTGDTLGGIAQKTGVPVERLQELNPGLDQFQLTRGQRIKLR